MFELEGGWLLVLVLAPTCRPANMLPGLPAAALGALASPPSKSPALMHMTLRDSACKLYVGYIRTCEKHVLCHGMQRGTISMFGLHNQIVGVTLFMQPADQKEKVWLWICIL